ncbi:hypothetical protein MKX03_031107 [Papaver bracteatum]|nr:hypothetical protein MKX03_031107 [Papaver bracteatum]
MLRIAKMDKRSAMSENKKKEIREKQCKAYAMRRIRVGVAANNEHIAEPTGEHRAESSFIPRRSPRIELQQRELQLQKRRAAMRERRSSMDENLKHQILEKSRSAMKERRSLVTGNEKQLILEQRRRDYETRRTRLVDATNNEHIAGPSNERNDVPVMNLSRSPRLIEQGEVSRKRKGKEVSHDKHKQSRANSYVPDRNTLESLVTRDTSDDDDVADDDNRISRHVHAALLSKLFIAEARDFYSNLNVQDIPEYQIGGKKLTKSTLTEPEFGRCCLEGRIILPNLRVPPEEFIKLLEGTDEVAKSFQENIRR